MKFISKLLWCLVMENVAFFNPHLRKIIFKICTQEITRKSEQIRKQSKNKSTNLVPRTYRFRKFSKFLMSQIDKNNIFPG